MGKTEQYKGKKYLTTDDYILDGLLDKTKIIIGIKKFDYTKILADQVTLKNVVIFISRVIEDRDKLCSPRVLKEGTIKSDGKLVKVGEKGKILVIS